MGICWGSPSNIQNPSSTADQFSSSVGTSRTTSNATSSDESNSSGNSRFSAASGNYEADPNGQILPTPNLRIFSFSELKNATRNFRTDTVLGEGGFGKVYKGWLDEKVTWKNGSGSVVAVKKLNSESMQGFQEWQSEVNFLGRLSHPNLVKLLGYCWEDKELLLVYEFMQKGSLENHLFGRGSAVQSLPWDIRLKILIGAARGLAFLHTSEKQVIYRDFKASNILLDGSYNAKISDFGLAKLGPSASQSHVTTRVMGTYGYAAPEYVATGHLYVKSDVYGFGVVLVEMLTGLRALDTTRPSGKQNLADWAKPYLSERRKLKNIMDSRLEGNYPSKAALQIAHLALTCLGPEPKTRPSMKEVVETLVRIDAGNEKPKEPRIKSSHHTAYRRGQQPLHHRSPLHPRQDGQQSYQLPQRACSSSAYLTSAMDKIGGGRASWFFEDLCSFLRNCLFSVLSVGPLPNHIAFIMDGNRRYAKKWNMKESAGHSVGYSALMSMLRYCYEVGVKYVTVYAFSIENFKRGPEEVQSLMDLMQEKIEGLIKEGSILNMYGVRVHFIGNLKLLSKSVREAAERAMVATANNSQAVLSICVAYTSIDEIVNTVQRSCEEKWISCFQAYCTGYLAFKILFNV